jgi:hypothetical protein
MANSLDVDDAFNAAHAQVETWKAEFMAEWYGPQIEQTGLALWMNLPEPVRQAYRLQNPAAARVLDDRMKKVGGQNATS